MKYAVVTGGMGFLGSCLVAELMSRNYKVAVLDRHGPKDAYSGIDHFKGDILDQESLVKSFAGADVVYHMAGSLGTSELNKQAISSVQVNVIGSLNVFEAAIKAGVRCVFYPSKPNVWLNAYSITKATVDEFARLYNKEREIKICSLRYFNAYGPGQHLAPIRKIIPYFALQAMYRMPLEVFGDGEQTADMIYSKDVARITVDFTEKEYVDDIPDLGRGIPLTVNEIAAEVNAHFYNEGVVHLPMRSGETPNTKLVANTRLLRELLGELSFTDWRLSLTETLHYYECLSGATLHEAAECHNLLNRAG